MKSSYESFAAMLVLAIIVNGVVSSPSSVHTDPNPRGIWEQVQSLCLSIAPQQPQNQQPQNIEALRFGKKLFFDPRFSTNGQISCATCHQPAKAFTDGRAVAVGLRPLTRNTPTLANSAYKTWFFWDGRADSLESQALKPIEETDEHGFSRLKAYWTIRENYKDEYEHVFGTLPTLPDELKKQNAFPSPKRFQPSDNVIQYSLATLNSPERVEKILNGSQLAADFIDLISPLPSHPASWIQNYDALNSTQKGDLDQFFFNLGLAFAHFERTLQTTPTAFDSFLTRWKSADMPPSDAFQDSFSESEFEGLKIFVGRGRCTLCHSGPLLTDEQFHNIGLPLHNNIVDLGRALGVGRLKSDPYTCKSASETVESEACSESRYLDPENREIVGAFKTPSLRNVSNTAPYMHDGRFAHLSDVIDFYDTLADIPAVGHREETLKPLRLTSEQKKHLISFLESLSSPVISTAE